jgi:tetratricopeptide (TPR) repeat protein
MSPHSKRTVVTRDNILQVLSSNEQPKLTAKALLARLGGHTQSAGKLQKLLRRLERDGILEVEDKKYRMVNRDSTASAPSQSDFPVTKQVVARWKLVCVSFLLALLVLIAFYPGLSGQFVMLDDHKYVTSNSNIQNFSWQTIAWAFTSFDVSNWHPVTWLSLVLDYRFYKLEPFGYHLTSLVFHILNTLLVFLVLFRMTGAFWRSLAVAVLFGIHPLRVESVSWVSERKDVLSAFFWLLTMAAYLRYVRLKSVASYVLMAFTFSLGLMSKPVLVTLPAVLLLIDYWPLKRLNWPAVWEKLPLAALSVAGMVLTFVAQKEGGAVQIDPIPFFERTANAIVSYVQYLRLTVWPHNLSPWYSHPSLEGPPLSPMHVAGAAAFLVGITALLLHKNLRKSILPVGWFWYLGTLVPMIGILQVGRQGMADRYTYIPHIGLMILLVWGIAALPIWKSSRVRIIGFAVAVGITVTLTTLSWKQTVVWQNSLNLWSFTAERSPYSFIAHQGLGFRLRRLGRNDEAIIALEHASALRPEISSVHSMLGDLLTKEKHFDIALTHYQEAAALEPDSARNHYKLGLTRIRLGEWQAARGPLEQAITIKPNYAEAHYNLGRYWLASGNPAEAANEFEMALSIRPDYHSARRYLNRALSRLE